MARGRRTQPPRTQLRHPAHLQREYLDRFPRAGSIAMHEGSWGAEGTNQVWMNPETSWTYTHIYPAELYTRDVATAGNWDDSSLGKRIVQQLLPRASPPRILRLAVPDHHRRRPRLRRDSLPHPQRPVQRAQSHLPDLRIHRRHLRRAGDPPRRDRATRQDIPQHRPRSLGRRRKTGAP